ncbi:MAG: glutathione synthase [Deltaproteobacteria bacterium]|nr:glutathione synthase [Deltaproteobacteria bacterium]
MALDLLFVMDPIDRISIDGDSTFVMMLEAQARGHRVLYAELRNLELLDGSPAAYATPVSLRRKRNDHFTLGSPELVRLDDMAAVFMRKDPPFDVEYLVSTWVLDRVDRKKVVLVNDPRGLRDSNEKLFALAFPGLSPRTLIARDQKRLRAFIDELGDCVVKPLTLAGGAGVIRLLRGDRNTGSVLDLLTQEGRVAIAAQAYIPAVAEGDRRILLIDGEPVGVVNRRPQANDLRSNMHVGGTPEKASLTERDREICRAVGPELRSRGLAFVGIDVIGGWLTEINVTSPTGIQEINRFDGSRIEADLIDWVEARHRSLTYAEGAAGRRDSLPPDLSATSFDPKV